MTTTPSAAAPSPTTWGTDTVTATAVEVSVPQISGRVTAVAGGTISLTGPDGQLLTVSTSTTTRYLSGTTTSSASAVTVGTRIVAEGSEDTLTHLNADVIEIVPTTIGAPGDGFPGFGRGPDGAPAAFGTQSTTSA